MLLLLQWNLTKGTLLRLGDIVSIIRVPSSKVEVYINTIKYAPMF